MSNHPPELSTSSTVSTSEVSYDESDDELTLSPVDVAVMQRLAKKANLLPIISRADSLADDKLEAIKKVVRRDLSAAGLDFGVFAPAESSADARSTPTRGPSNGTANGVEDDDDDTPEPEEERRSRPVIKLRPPRNMLKRFTSRSRSRLDLTENPDEPNTAEIMDNESVASVRFSAQIVAKTELSDILPFALIAPEYTRARRIFRPLSGDRQSFQTETGTSIVAPSDDGHEPASIMSSPVSERSKHAPYLNGPPADLKGVFVRKFRWGTVDVLAPEHCDFAALRTAVFSTHMKMLKVRTKEVLYERYRTEKLLARRATAKISEVDRRRMFEEIGL